MDVIKIDDPRLDESYPSFFAFRKGDAISTRIEPFLNGRITDGVYLGHLPKAAADINARGKTLYEITLSNQETHIIDEADIKR